MSTSPVPVVTEDDIVHHRDHEGQLMSNQTLLQETADALRAYTEERIGLDELQARLQSVMTLLERTDDAGEVAKVVRNVEGDLELITSTVFGDDVRPAVMAAVEPLRPHLPPVGGRVGP